MEVTPKGYAHIVLKGHDGEHYLCERPKTYVRNIVAGKMYIEHVGPLRVLNTKTAESCELEFFARDAILQCEQYFVGKAFSGNNEAKYDVWGDWT